jgi:RNA polymerase sigma factor (sigma-70 family)
MRQEPDTARIEDLLVHADWLRRLAAHLVQENDAEDLVQDTLAAAIHAAPDTDRPIKPWLGTVLRNLVRTRWRSEKVQQRNQAGLRAAATTTASPEELLERAQLQRKLAEAVIELDEPYRSAILLRYYESRSSADVARELGLPAGTVRWRLSEGIERLRRRLDERHGGNRKTWTVLLAPAATEIGARPAPPALVTQGPLWMALGTKAKLGLSTAVLLVVVLGLLAQRWRPGPRAVDEGGSTASSVVARTGLPRLMPAGSVSGDSGTVEGVVHDPEGRPLARAVVALTSDPRGGDAFGPRRAAATALTDGTGRFRWGRIPPGEHRVSATAAGLAPALSMPFVLGPQEGRQLVLTLAAGGHVLDGTVLDDGGGPIPGARVTVWAGSGGSLGPAGPATLYQVVADDQGRYRISLAAREYTVRGEASGYAPSETTVPVTRNLRRDLRLHPAARISGVVLERATRQPVPDALVSISPMAWRMAVTGRPGDVRTDAQGAFVADDLVGGSYQVLARLGAAQGVGPEVAVVPTQTVQGLEVLLDEQQSAAVVEGQVVDTAGKGIAGARIVAGNGAVSGPDGRFRLTGVGPGPALLKVSSPDPELGDADQMLTVGADGARDVNIVISASPRLTGRVVDAAGLPVPGAQVRVDPQGRDVRPVVVETLADGSFKMSGLPEGRAWLMAWHPTLGVNRQDFGPMAARHTQRIELRLAPGGSISGTVKLDDGSPAAGVSVGFSGQQRGGLYTSVATGEDGSFTTMGLPAGKYTVRARRKAGPWNVSTSVERPDLHIVTIDEGEQRRGVDLVLKRGGQSIAGQVVLPDGKPAAGTTVVANIEENGRSWRPTGVTIEHSAVSREDGSFTLHDIESGSFTLWAARPGVPESSLQHVTAGRRDVRIVLQTGTSLAGVVVDENSQAVPRFSLNVIPAAASTPEERMARDFAGMTQRPVNDPAGAFTWGGLTPGTYEIQVRTADGAGARQTVTLVEGEQKQDVRVVLASGAKIIGSAVSLETGETLARLRIYARIAGRHAEAVTDSRGAFELTGLLPGEAVEVRVTGGEDLVPETKHVVVPAGVSRVDAGVFRLMKRDPKRPLRLDGTLRLVVESRDEKVRVTIVRPGSPAEKAGIAVGDAILAIDGRDVRGLGPGAIHHLLERKPGTSVALLVRSSGGDPRSVTATTEPLGRPVAAKP